MASPAPFFSCYAFAAAKSYSGSLYKSTNGLYNVEISEQQMVSCYAKSQGCNGGSMAVVYKEMNKDGRLMWVVEPCSGMTQPVCRWLLT